MGCMNATLSVALIVVLLGALLPGSAANADNSTAYTIKNSTEFIIEPPAREDLIAFVNEARDFVLAEGRDKALQVFNDPLGKFVRGELYIIAYDFNGTRLAHPFQPQAIGQSALNATDPNGVALVRNMIEEAKKGSGFTYYVWPNPTHSNESELKLTYVQKVDDGLWLGAGVYLPGEAPIFNKTARESIISFVKMARDFALNNTRDASLKAFNDKNGRFVKGDRYIYAYDFKGNTLALPFEPDLIGTNRLNIQDPNGLYPVQGVVDAAKNGDGFVYAIYKDPAENMTPKLKLDYVMKVNDGWFLGSGIYWP